MTKSIWVYVLAVVLAIIGLVVSMASVKMIGVPMLVTGFIGGLLIGIGLIVARTSGRILERYYD